MIDVGLDVKVNFVLFNDFLDSCFYRFFVWLKDMLVMFWFIELMEIGNLN